MWPAGICAAITSNGGVVTLTLRPSRFRAALSAAIIATVTACSTPAAPTPTTTTTTTAPVVNTPPVINSITIPARAEVDTDVPVTASVQDAETPISNLTFVWTASAGAFSGSGPSVTWRLPKGSVATPINVTMSLEVIEHYQDMDPAGHPITKTNDVKASATPIAVDDSPTEITNMAVTFLVTYFGDSTVSPAACLVDFSDSCQGKADELSDIIANRATFVIHSAVAHVASIQFDAAMDFANIDAPCTFHDQRLDNGQLGTSDGQCLLTAVYQNQRWWLCDSHYQSN